MKIIKKIKKYLIDRGLFKYVSDEKVIKKQFKKRIGKTLDLNNVKTYNEKLQWLKLHDRNDLYTKLVDKYEVKKIVSKIIGDEYIIPTLGVWEKFNDIDFDKLPEQFVLKCTHDSGGIIICKDKNKLNYKKAKFRFNRIIKRNYYYRQREWPYKNIKPRIIAEPYLEDKKYGELRDYKFFVFNGEVKLMYIATNRQGNGETYFDFFDKKFNHLDIINGHPNAPVCPEKPVNFDRMIKLAEKIAKNFIHARVDFYEVNGKIYFGEITFYHMSGFVPFVPEKWDLELGQMIILPKKGDDN